MQPVLVVARLQIFCRRHTFDSVAEFIDVKVSADEQRGKQRKYPAFPLAMMEIGLVFLSRDRAKAVHFPKSCIPFMVFSFRYGALTTGANHRITGDKLD